MIDTFYTCQSCGMYTIKSEPHVLWTVSDYDVSGRFILGKIVPFEKWENYA